MNSLIGKRIKELRLSFNLTREELGQQLGVTYSAIAMYEQGNREPNIELIVKIAQIFNISIDYLLKANFDNKVRRNTNTKSNLQQILKLANGLTIQETNYLIKQLNKAKIRIEKGGKSR